MSDENWRTLAVYLGSDTTPKEEYVNHNAGLDGFGGSSMLDGVVCRYRDANTAWNTTTDGSMEEKVYYCQNFRGDVSAIVTSDGKMLEWIKYSAYGIPFALPAGDTDSDGDCDSTDVGQILTWKNAGHYDVRGDLDLDGDVDATDRTTAIANFQGTTLGWGVLSNIANRKGYAGYERDINLSKLWHVRNRVLDSELGRWTRRDPIGYSESSSLYQYGDSQVVASIDPLGEFTLINSGGGSMGSGSVIYTVVGPQGNKKLQPYPINSLAELYELPEIVAPGTDMSCCLAAESKGKMNGTIPMSAVGFVACCGNPPKETPCAIRNQGPIENRYANALITAATLKHEQKHIDLKHQSCNGCKDHDPAKPTPLYTRNPGAAELEPTLVQLEALKGYYLAIGHGYQLIETEFSAAQDYYKANAKKAGVPKSDWPPIVTETLKIPPP